jgi:hypothetical protein
MRVTMRRYGEWDTWMYILSGLQDEKYGKRVREALKKDADRVAAEISRIYRGSAMPPGDVRGLHPITVVLKNSSTIFKDTGQLSRAVEVVQKGKMSYVVTIKKQAKTDDGYEYHKVAKVLEYGTEIAVTDAMRGFLQNSF